MATELKGITKEEIKNALSGLGKTGSEDEFNNKLAEVLAQLAAKVIQQAKNS